MPTQRNTEVHSDMSIQSTERMLHSYAQIGIVALRVVFKWNMIYLFHPQLVLFQDTVDCGQADLVKLCQIDTVFQDF